MEKGQQELLDKEYLNFKSISDADKLIPKQIVNHESVQAVYAASPILKVGAHGWSYSFWICAYCIGYSVTFIWTILKCLNF